MDYDASMVPAEWYGWLHYKTDKTPLEKAPVHYDWMPDHTPNTSGSSAGKSNVQLTIRPQFCYFPLTAGAGTLMGSKNAYMPYTTTKPKVESWVPPQK